MWIFGAWLCAFYSAWLALVSLGGLWQTVRDHWPIALSMALGSYFAGSTPTGGGTIGFPVLVLMFDFPASMGRNFGFAVQSIGMVSASIFIMASRQRVDWNVLKPAMAVAAIATPLCAMFVAPHVPSQVATLVFGVVVASFGLIHLTRMPAVVASEALGTTQRVGVSLGIIAGLTGSAVASLTGVGIDVLLYMGLVAWARVDLRIAIPTSVIIMAFTSLVGIASNVALGTVDPSVWANWLAAAPVVALGAPFGAVAVTYLSRRKTLMVTSVLCVIQLVWSCVQQRVVGLPLVATLVGVVAVSYAFHHLFRVGERQAAPMSTVPLHAVAVDSVTPPPR